jgi:hypothetical protein
MPLFRKSLDDAPGGGALADCGIGTQNGDFQGRYGFDFATEKMERSAVRRSTNIPNNSTSLRSRIGQFRIF